MLFGMPRELVGISRVGGGSGCCPAAAAGNATASLRRSSAMPYDRSLRYVDPRVSRGVIYRAYVRLASNRFATWLATTTIWSATVWTIDRYLLRLTGGRLGTGLLLPTALLQTRGARSGLLRRNAVIYFHDGDRVTIIASRAGRPGNPAWYYNALANPEVLLGGQPYRAQEVTDEASVARLWELADRVFPGFAAYRSRAARAGRKIPVLQLVPARDSAFSRPSAGAAGR